MDTNNFEENIFIKGLFSVENKIKKETPVKGNNVYIDGCLIVSS